MYTHRARTDVCEREECQLSTPTHTNESITVLVSIRESLLSGASLSKHVLRMVAASVSVSFTCGFPTQIPLLDPAAWHHIYRPRYRGPKCRKGM